MQNLGISTGPINPKVASPEDGPREGLARAAFQFEEGPLISNESEEVAPDIGDTEVELSPNRTSTDTSKRKLSMVRLESEKGRGL